jgi:hypothetical protein
LELQYIKQFKGQVNRRENGSLTEKKLNKRSDHYQFSHRVYLDIWHENGVRSKGPRRGPFEKAATGAAINYLEFI